jgi:photosystem II stability/assembly factor-like uncharacterized protein
MIYAGTCSGVYYTDDIAHSWHKGSEILDSKNIISIAFMDALIFTLDNQGSVYQSNDNGLNWNFISSNPGAHLISINNSEIYCASSRNSTNGSLSRSTDGGLTWLSMNLNNNLSINDLLFSDKYLFAGGENGVYRTSDNGLNWEHMANGFCNDVNVYSLKSDSENLYAGTKNGVYRSTNKGESWFPINNGISTKQPFYSLENNNGVLFATEYAIGVYNSTNNGQSWEPCNSGLKDNLIYKLISFKNNLIACSQGGGVYVTISAYCIYNV